MYRDLAHEIVRYAFELFIHGSHELIQRQIDQLINIKLNKDIVVGFFQATRCK